MKSNKHLKFKTPTLKKLLSSKSFRIISTIIALLAVCYFFLFRPYRVMGSPIPPLSSNQIVFTESISLIANDPNIGDVVIFESGADSDIIGMIVDYYNEEYVIMSSLIGKEYSVSRSRIKSKLIYPTITEQEKQQVISKYLSDEDYFQDSETIDKAIDKNTQEYENKTQKNINTSPSFTPSPSVPTSSPNPPQVVISYPLENQSIQKSEGLDMCIVDTPTGGNTSNLLKKYKLNNNQWTNYQPNSTTCYNPTEGNQSISFQYKNEDGEESSIITRNFYVDLISTTQLTYSGKTYSDDNCNAIKDSNESYISVSTTVRLLTPEYVTYATGNVVNGQFSLSYPVTENISLTLASFLVAPPGYKIGPSYNPIYKTFTYNDNVFNVDVPIVPNSNVGNCTI